MSFIPQIRAWHSSPYCQGGGGCCGVCDMDPLWIYCSRRQIAAKILMCPSTNLWKRFIALGATGRWSFRQLNSFFLGRGIIMLFLKQVTCWWYLGETFVKLACCFVQQCTVCSGRGVCSVVEGRTLSTMPSINKRSGLQLELILGNLEKTGFILGGKKT